MEMTLMLFGTFLATVAALFPWFEDNHFFLLAQNWYIGASCALGFFVVYRQLVSLAVSPISMGHFSLIIAVFLGVLVFTRLTKFRWLARYATSVITGVALGVSVGPTVSSALVAPIRDTVSDIATLSPDPLSSIIRLFVFIICITYFLYSIKYSYRFNTGRWAIVNKLAHYCLYAVFGYLLSKVLLRESFGWLSNLAVAGWRRTILELMEFLGIS